MGKNSDIDGIWLVREAPIGTLVAAAGGGNSEGCSDGFGSI